MARDRLLLGVVLGGVFATSGMLASNIGQPLLGRAHAEGAGGGTASAGTPSGVAIGGNNANNDIVSYSQTPNQDNIVVIDSKTMRMAIYSNRAGELTLLTARNISWDLRLEDTGGQKPTVEDVKKKVEALEKENAVKPPANKRP